ncbi:MAG TPA: DUF4142 domain-containing protein [Longimicrobiales bacterium]|nr:DUF4142 domain-containing protein [Longimicrobiales bacterium]
MWKLRVLPLALTIGIVACGGNDDQDDGMAVAQDSLAIVETPEQTQDLLSPIRAVSMSLITYADMGTQRGAREDIREFARTVATDHRGLVPILDREAQARGATLEETTPGRELASAVRLAHAGLENLQEADFDLAYIRAEVESHRQLLDTIDHELIPAATSPAMQTLLQDTRAMVYAHLMRARQLLGNLLGQPVEPPPPGTAPEQVPRPPQPDTTPPTAPPGGGGGSRQ